ncbi:hypothetical protein SAMN05444008_10799 [Cnuella takakiae]|uniref:Uncharacterized protein n=1 Tax=Cnuella takakiae TaxID=1302690 RepID=A0A1M5B1X5_9BACT|nr:hypothetical protein [Cnuella takakiae]OLY93300.1 hypothetical protein BUE76_16470 [Cnuella takakiae]SHF36406.1 hypothetical protein SAMN05444008_10799 [Cnuella takakiae]
MKRTLFAAFIGGLLLFIVQFLSWGLLNLHQPAQQYTSRQDSILNFLQQQQLPAGGYLMPNVPENASMQEYDQMLLAAEGKPWVSIQYHHRNNSRMGLNMARGLATNILTVGLLCWILGRWRRPQFRSYFMAALFTGTIVFLNAPYTYHIWYQSFDLYAHLFDALAGWALCGVWLGWYLPGVQQKSTRPDWTAEASTMNID